MFLINLLHLIATKFNIIYIYIYNINVVQICLRKIIGKFLQ